MYFKSSIALVAAAALVACGEQATTVDPATTAKADTAVVTQTSEDARVAAVLIRADWCSSCKLIEPKLNVVRAAPAIDGLEHVTLDYTNRDVDGFFAAADAAGVGPAIRAQLGDDVITGIILLVDMDEMAVVGDLRKELSPDELAAAMKAAAEA